MVTYGIIFVVLLVAELVYFKIADKCNIIDKRMSGLRTYFDFAQHRLDRASWRWNHFRHRYDAMADLPIDD